LKKKERKAREKSQDERSEALKEQQKWQKQQTQQKVQKPQKQQTGKPKNGPQGEVSSSSITLSQNEMTKFLTDLKMATILPLMNATMHGWEYFILRLYFPVSF